MERKYMLFFDQNNANWSCNTNYNRAFVKQSIRYLNDMYKAYGWLTVKQVFDTMETKYKPAFYTGCFGWDKVDYEPDTIEFDIQEFTGGNGDTVFAITFTAKQIVFMEAQ